MREKKKERRKGGRERDFLLILANGSIQSSFVKSVARLSLPLALLAALVADGCLELKLS